MKQSVRAFLRGSVCLLLLFTLTSLPTDAVRKEEATGGSRSWCIKRNDCHLQPAAELSDEALRKYNAYYVDRTHGDDCEEKVLYLTFDAGYENGNIAKVLDVLEEEKVPAAFFVLKYLITHDASLVERMETEGHLVCNHTMRHPDMTLLDDAAFAEEVSGLASLYEEYFGKKMAKYYRPPEGKYSLADLERATQLGYKTVFWSFAYADWDNDHQPKPEAAKKKIRDNMHNGAVLLLHPTSATNAEILRDLIVEWKKEGYRFGTLDELTGG